MGDAGQTAPANKVQKVKSVDVWEALRNSLKKDSEGPGVASGDKGGQNEVQNV